MKRSFKKSLVFLALAVLMAAVAAVSISASAAGKWIGAWGSGMTEVGVAGYDDIGVTVGNATCRSVISPTASGSKIRLRLSNVYGISALKINRITVARSTGKARIDPKTVVPVYFGGKRDVIVPAGMEVYSDPVNFKVTALENIAVSTYIPSSMEIRTCGFSGGYSYISMGGNNTTVEVADFSVKLKYSLVSVVPFLSAVDVYSEDSNAYSVVVIGDSTVSNDFPYYLAKQINDKGVANVGVVGKGIIGNSLLTGGIGIGAKIYGDSLLNRLDVDALSQAGVEYVVVKIGCNDIIHPRSNDNDKEYGIRQPTATELINGYKELADRCHKAGVKIVGVAIMQWKGYTRDFFGTGAKYKFRDEDWAIAQKVNKWMATAKELDGFVNLNNISKDPNDPMAINPKYTEDGGHPNEALQLLWAKKFPLSVIGVGTRVTGVTLNKAQLSLGVGSSYTLKPTVSPSKATDKGVTWTSSDKKICTVSSKGVVKAVAKGTCLIYCQTKEGGYRAACIVSTYIPVTGLSLKSAETVHIGQPVTLKATVSPSNAGNKTVTWSSSNKEVAKVSSKGVVTAVKPGSAVITCKTADGGIKKTCKVTVPVRVAVTKVKLNKDTVNLTKGDTYTLSATISPAKASNKNLSWTSSKPSIAAVDKNGEIIAKSSGIATITCKSRDNGLYDTCRVNVTSYVTEVRLNKVKANAYVGKTVTLKATVYPSDVLDKTVKWSSSDKSVATVNQSGVVTGVSQGTAVITCKSKDGSERATCTITVKKWVKVTSVKLSTASEKAKIGEHFIITETVYPKNASDKKVKWSSSNTSVASVSKDGVITAVAPGTCVITCTTVSEKKTATCKITVSPPAVKGISLNRTTLSMLVGRSTTLKATLKPKGAKSKLTWTSSKKSVVTVDSKGKLTAKAPGTAVITVKTANGKYSATCKVTVNRVKVASVTLNRATLKMYTGASFKLTATVKPADAANKAVVWSTSNSAVATVSGGTVKALKAGTAVITCQTKDGGFKARCVVNVEKRPTTPVLGVKLNVNTLNLKVGGTYQLVAKVLPSTATNKFVFWSSSDSSVVRTSNSGLITAVRPGRAVITVKTLDGSWKDTCTVYVS